MIYQLFNQKKQIKMEKKKRVIRSKQDIVNAKREFFVWLMLKRGTQISVQEVDEKIKESIKDLSIMTCLRQLGYVEGGGGHYTVGNHFDYNDSLLSKIKMWRQIQSQEWLKRKRERGRSAKATLPILHSTDDKMIKEIHSMLSTIVNKFNL